MANDQPSDHQRKIIQKVPSWLREVEHTSDAYDPKAVSFGPYHHGKPELQFCQDAKRRTLKMLVDGAGDGRDEHFFKSKVLAEVLYARSCYVDGSTDRFTDEEFAEMMLLDASFLLYLMIVTDQSNGCHYMEIYNYLGRLVDKLVNQDIFLLENQIPFRIVMLLIELRYGEKRGEEALLYLLHKEIWDNFKEEEKQEIINKIREDNRNHPPLHLFEAFHRVLVWDSVKDTHPESHSRSKDSKSLRKTFGSVDSSSRDSRSLRKTFRSATDLKAKGIHFRPSAKRSLKSITFRSFTFHGQLELPVWFVSRHSKVFFPNMIAYELCPCNSGVDKTVTSYLTFMKSLIEKAADVKELREKRILLTSLGSDEDVMEFYRGLDTFEIGGLFSLREVKDGIQEHYDSRMKTWRAELIHAYLSSPWSIIAWLAALTLLILTFLQTYFTIVGVLSDSASAPSPR